MDRDQKILIVVFLLLLAVTVGVFVFFGGGGPVYEGGGAFRARPGTEREETLPMVSEQAYEQPEEDADSEPGERESRASAEVREETPTPPPAPPSLSEQILAQSLSVLTPEQAAGELRDSLSDPLGDEQRAEVHAALAKLQLTEEVGAASEALENYGAAIEHAEFPSQREALALQGARLLWEAGEPAAADELIQSARDNGPESLEGIQLRILEGRIKTDAGQADEAEAAYRAALEALEEPGRPMGQAAESTYRQACLQLSRLLETQGREDDAAAIAEALRERQPTARVGLAESE
ncbi:MAG: hypothetical protein ACLFU6_02885 [Candidatus Hydrogenedentota bacterium]